MFFLAEYETDTPYSNQGGCNCLDSGTGRETAAEGLLDSGTAGTHQCGVLPDVFLVCITASA